VIPEDQEGRDHERKLRNRFSRRALLFAAGQAGLFGLLGWRLRQLQILDSSEYRLLSDENRITFQLVAPGRGTIFDRFGGTLAEDRENLRVLVVPVFCKDLAATLEAIGHIVPVSAAEKDRVRRAARRQSGYFPVLVTEGISWRQFALLNILAPQLPGVQTDSSSYRLYPAAQNTAHVVGYVGMAGKAEVDEDPMMRLPGFRTGKTGIEKGFDKALRGSPGTIRYEVDAHGRIVRELGKSPSKRGRDLVLTIDRSLQAFAQKRLEENRVASIVALDALTGEVLVMASHPTFNPNDIAFRSDPARIAQMARVRDQPFENRALRGLYPPGSTFKVCTALAGLAGGVITPQETMTCPGSYAVGRRRFRCWKRHGGGINVHEALKQSCDVYFYETAARLGINNLAAMARKLGLGQTYPCGLAGQKKGIVPDTAWKRAMFNEPWYGGETVVVGIGQGFLLTTPLQLAVMVARVATGRAILPRLLTTEPGEPVEAPPLDVNPAVLDAVRDGMIAVVNEKGGTAVRSALTLPDVQMAGKTGTSQVISSRNQSKLTGWEGETHALFIAFAPTVAPRYAVACVVEHGGGGSHTAAPIVRDLMTEILLSDPVSRSPFVVAATGGEGRMQASAGGAP
jgi:penicillin-binding protein 2